MGLNPRHLKEFQSQRVYSSVILENVPQLILQIVFLTKLGSFDEATFIALLSSSISVILSIVDIWSAQRMLKVMDNQNDGRFSANNIEFTIHGQNSENKNSEINDKKRVLLTKPRALAKAIAETLVVDERTVEIYQLIASDDGIKVGFNVYSVDHPLEDILRDLLERENHIKMKLLITKHWRLKQYPEISEFREEERRNSANLFPPNGGDRGYGTHTLRTKKRTLDVTYTPLNKMSSVYLQHLRTNDPQLHLTSLNSVSCASDEDVSPSSSEPLDGDMGDEPHSPKWNAFRNNLQKYAGSQTEIYKSLYGKLTADTEQRDSEDVKNGNQGNVWMEYVQNIKTLMDSKQALMQQYGSNDENLYAE